MTLHIYCLSTSCYSEGLNPLPGVENSIAELKPLLEENGNLHLSSNLNSTGAKNDFLIFLGKLKQVSDPVVLFYFCGHGFLTGTTMDHLMLGTTDTSSKNFNAVGIDCQWIFDELSKAKIHKYMAVLDCCHSGIMTAMGESSFNLENGVAILSSTFAPHILGSHLKIGDKDYAVFTHLFAQVLASGINSGRDMISLEEIYTELCRKIKNTDDLTQVSLPQLKSKNKFAQIRFFKNRVSESLNRIIPAERKLKVLLVKTAIDFPIKNYDFGVPMGLWLLKSYVELQGINAKIEIYDERLELLRGNCIHFEDVIKEYDVVGVSICTCEVPNAMKKLAVAKQQEKITFVGGIFCSSNERYLLASGSIDYVIPGVATLPFANLLRELIKGNKTGNHELVNHIVGVITKQNMDSLNVWRPTQLPYIELRVWKQVVERYGCYLGGKIDIFTTRGCNQRCNFCSVQKECQQKIFQRDTRSIIEEIEYLYSEGFRHFSIKDEDFALFGEQHLIQVLEKCSSSLTDITFKIRARADRMIRGKISLENLRNIGVREIQYGLETPDQTLLSNIQKGYSYGSDALRQLIVQTADCGITANCSFILGIRGESKEYYKSLLDFFSSVDVNEQLLKIYVNFLTPHPYKNEFPKGEYYLTTNDLMYFTHKNPVCYPHEMPRLVRVAMLETYDAIVQNYNMAQYNPQIDADIRETFIAGTKVKRVIPTYKYGEDN